MEHLVISFKIICCRLKRQYLVFIGKTLKYFKNSTYEIFFYVLGRVFKIICDAAVKVISRSERNCIRLFVRVHSQPEDSCLLFSVTNPALATAICILIGTSSVSMDLSFMYF